MTPARSGVGLAGLSGFRPAEVADFIADYVSRGRARQAAP